MAQFDIYLKENENDEFATYYTTIEANSLEEAEKIAEDISDAIECGKENYRLESEYDAKGDELLDIKDIVDNSQENPDIYPYCS